MCTRSPYPRTSRRSGMDSTDTRPPPHAVHTLPSASAAAVVALRLVDRPVCHPVRTSRAVLARLLRARRLVLAPRAEEAADALALERGALARNAGPAVPAGPLEQAGLGRAGHGRPVHGGDGLQRLGDLGQHTADGGTAAPQGKGVSLWQNGSGSARKGGVLSERTCWNSVRRAALQSRRSSR